MKIMAYPGNRYVSLLTKGDVMELFKKLEEKVGSVAEVCRLVGIERGTFYHWKLAKDIREETKRRLLEVFLDRYPEETLEFLADRGLERVTEVLASLLKAIYIRAVEAEDKEEFKDALRRFSEALEKYDRPIIDRLGDLGELVLSLADRAREMGLRGVVVERPFATMLPISQRGEVKYFGTSHQTDLPQIGIQSMLSGGSTIPSQLVIPPKIPEPFVVKT